MLDMAKDTAREPHIGRPLPRFEDRRLVAGRGRFTDDVAFDGQAYAAFVRSPHPHARIRSIDTGAAAKLPGVVASSPRRTMRQRVGAASATSLTRPAPMT